MALPVSFYGNTIADNTVKSNGEPETSTWAVPITTLTAANLVAQTALIVALQSAINALILGNVAKEETVVLRQFPTPGPATNILAQRENKWLIRYHDLANNSKFRVSIPTADLSQLIAHSEFVDVTAGNGLALKNAFEAIVRSPDNSSDNVILDSIQFVGRNS